MTAKSEKESTVIAIVWYVRLVAKWPLLHSLCCHEAFRQVVRQLLGLLHASSRHGDTIWFMPRQTPQQKREKTFLGAIGKHTAELGLYRECDIAQYVGMSLQSWGKYRAKNFQMHGLLVFSLIARRLGFTGREVCAIVGVPYEDPRE